MGDTKLAMATLAVVLLVLPTAVAEDARPVATVSFAGPHEVLVAGGGSTEFQLHVSSRLECASGFKPPRDLLVLPTAAAGKDGAEALWQVEPASVRVAWSAAPGEPDVYLIDALATFNVTTKGVPDTPVETETELLVREVQDQRPGLHCQVDGYDVEAEDHALSLMVVPADPDADAASSEAGDDPPVRWVPMVLAIAILASLAGFATLRERQRRGS